MADAQAKRKECETPGPGPAAYALPTTVGYKSHDSSRWRGPAFTLHPRISPKPSGAGVPGPSYAVWGLTRFGPAPKLGYSIRGRTSFKRKEQTPGPGAYSPGQIKPKCLSKGFSLRARVPKPKGFVGPGPVYLIPTSLGPTVPDLKAGPAYTLKGLLGGKKDSRSPGPAAYSAGNMNAIRYTSPGVPMGRRTGMKGKERSPGPLAYNPTGIRTGPRPPKYSFGRRHNSCIKPYITSQDDPAE